MRPPGPVAEHLFADYRPRDRGVPLEVDVRGLAATDVDGCVTLAVRRNGGEPATWRRSFVEILGRDDQHTVVAVHDDRVVAYASTAYLRLSDRTGAVNAPDAWYLTGVVVAPEVRRRGVGRRLTEARLDWLAARTDAVWYFAAALNRASLDLHAELGFQEVTRDFAVPGVTFTGGEGVLSVKHLREPSGRSAG